MFHVEHFGSSLSRSGGGGLLSCFSWLPWLRQPRLQDLLRRFTFGRIALVVLADVLRRPFPHHEPAQSRLFVPRLEEALVELALKLGVGLEVGLGVIPRL